MNDSNKKQRVCVIGAGPSGMATLYYFAKLGDSAPDVTCYEKDATWGGMWNLTWRTGTYDNGERVTSAMYRTMWINGPKEVNELPHYTFMKHFGKNVPSCFTASVLRRYLEGYWKSSETDLSKKIMFNTAVTSVKYNADTDDFTVVTRDLVTRNTNPPETFSHVVVGSGNCVYPNAPEFKGFDTFPGRILHSQQFRGGQEFKGKRVLAIGAALSGEDVASQCNKYGASHVIISWRTRPLGYKFPEGIEERPLLQEVNGKVATFKDGSTAEIDVIVLCTGYNMAFPFLEDSLRLAELGISYFPGNLYKGIVWLGGGNNKLLYLGMVYVPVQTPLADAQAAWAVRYITGINPIHPEQDKIQPGLNVDADTVNDYLTAMKKKFHGNPEAGVLGLIEPCQGYLQEIVDDVGHGFDAPGIIQMMVKTFTDRTEDCVEFRNKQFTSLYTGVTSEPPKIKWIHNFGDNVEDDDV